MADAFSWISILILAADKVNQAKVFIDSIRGAPECVKHLSRDLAALQKPLTDLKGLTSQATGFNEETKKAIAECLSPALSGCEDASIAIKNYLVPFVKPDSTPKTNIWRRLQFSFKEATVYALRDRLINSKNSLQIATGVATILIQDRQFQQGERLDRGMRRMQRHFGIADSSVANSGYGPTDRGYIAQENASNMPQIAPARPPEVIGRRVTNLHEIQQRLHPTRATSFLCTLSILANREIHLSFGPGGLALTTILRPGGSVQWLFDVCSIEITTYELQYTPMPVPEMHLNFSEDSFEAVVESHQSTRWHIEQQNYNGIYCWRLRADEYSGDGQSKRSYYLARDSNSVWAKIFMSGEDYPRELQCWTVSDYFIAWERY